MENDLLDARQSTATQVARPAPEPPTGGSILNRTSALRDGVQFLNEDVTGLHHTVRKEELDNRTTGAAMRSPADLLRELSRERGLSWERIARLTGVSSAAVRKWRRGEALAADSRRAVARIVAFLEMITELASPIADPASWIEMALSDAATVTPADLYENDEIELLFELVSGCLSTHEVLDRFDPNWREQYARDARFEIAQAADGIASIVERD